MGARTTGLRSESDPIRSPVAAGAVAAGFIVRRLGRGAGQYGLGGPLLRQLRVPV